jgi:hypothetical protein
MQAVSGSLIILQKYASPSPPAEQFGDHEPITYMAQTLIAEQRPASATRTDVTKGPSNLVYD